MVAASSSSRANSRPRTVSSPESGIPPRHRFGISPSKDTNVMDVSIGSDVKVPRKRSITSDDDSAILNFNSLNDLPAGSVQRPPKIKNKSATSPELVLKISRGSRNRSSSQLSSSSPGRTSIPSDDDSGDGTQKRHCSRDKL